MLVSFNIGGSIDSESCRLLAAGLDKLQSGQQEVKSGLTNVSFRLEGLEDRVQLPGRIKVSASNTDHGQAIYNSLLVTSSVEVSPEGSGPAVLSADVIAAARSVFNMPRRPHESELVSMYTPSLMQLLKEANPNVCLVNSEYYQWLHIVHSFSFCPRTIMHPRARQ